jgi:hypothetical protein
VNTSERIKLDEREFLRLGFLGCPIEATWGDVFEFLRTNTGLRTKVLRLDYPLPGKTIQVIDDKAHQLIREITIPEGTFPEEELRKVAITLVLDCLDWDD